MNHHRFVATGEVPPVAAEILSPYGPIQVAPEPSEQNLIPWMSNTIGLIVRGDTPITRRIIEAGASLRVIGRSGVGYDNVDIDAATARGIPVVYTPGASSRAVAEGAMAFLLSLAKRLPELDRETRAGEWKIRDHTRIGDLQGFTLGLVGLGRIGKEIVSLARAFDMRVLAYDPYVQGDTLEGVEADLVHLDLLFAESDYIVLVAPLTEETRGIVTRSLLNAVKPGAIIANVGRGALFESLDAVYEALQADKLAGVGMDVFPEEPPDVSHPIFSHPRTLFTPHALGLSVAASRNIFVMMSKGMREVLEGRKPQNVVNPEVFGVHREAKSQ